MLVELYHCAYIAFFITGASYFEFTNSHTISDHKSISIKNLTMIRKPRWVKREEVDEKNWDIYPIVHDYFYESEDDEYITNHDYGRHIANDEFRPLCQSIRKRVELRSEVYEYHPPHYIETVCKRFTTSSIGKLERNTHNEMCLHPGFMCVQRTQTIYLTRKRFDNDCWETAKEVISAGCDCMWPNVPVRSQSENQS